MQPWRHQGQTLVLTANDLGGDSVCTSARVGPFKEGLGSALSIDS
jgi:hypothetical protein